MADPIPLGWNQVSTKVPLDPWENPYLYQFPGSRDPSQPEIISTGPDRIRHTADDFSSQDEK